MSEATTGAAVIPQFSVGDRLRKARELTGLDQAAFADEIGVSRQSVSNYELGNTKPRKIVLLAWQLRTGVPVQWLAHGVESVVPDGDGPVTSGLRDIPSGMSHDHEQKLTQAEILAFRKRVPLSPTDQAEMILSSTAPAIWRAAA